MSSGEQHNNNFTVLRFVAASMVIFGHTYDLRQIDGLMDPLRAAIGESLGWLGVTIFFSMSGYLIMKSLARSSNLLSFARARTLRILPGLAACMILLVILLGLFASTLPARAYFTDPQIFKFLAGNISLLGISHQLPGVFESNPDSAVNGSIWTLPFEVQCYVMAALLSAFGLLGSHAMRALTFSAALVGSLIFWLAHPLIATLPAIARIDVTMWLTDCFLLGMAYAAFGHLFKLRWWYSLPVGVIAWLVSDMAIYVPVLSLAFALLAFWIAFVPSPLLRRLSRAPDYSYGIYIYAFPIQQVLLATLPPLTPALHGVIAFVLVLIPASLSWHFVEKPALRLKSWRGWSRWRPKAVVD